MDVRTIGANEEPAVSLIVSMVDEMRVLYADLDLESSAMPSAAPADFPASSSASRTAPDLLRRA